MCATLRGELLRGICEPQINVEKVSFVLAMFSEAEKVGEYTIKGGWSWRDDHVSKIRGPKSIYTTRASLTKGLTVMI